MRKLFALLLAVTMTASLFAGCGNKPEETLDPPEEVSQAEVSQVEESQPEPSIDLDPQSIVSEKPSQPADESSKAVSPAAEQSTTNVEASLKTASTTLYDSFTVFTPITSGISEMAVKDVVKRIYNPISSENFQRVLNSLYLVTADLVAATKAPLPASGELGNLLIIQPDYQKIVYTIFESGIGIDKDFYPLTPAKMTNAKSLLEEINNSKGTVAYAEWLYWMRASRAIGVEVSPAGHLPASIIEETDAVREFVSFVRTMKVQPDSLTLGGIDALPEYEMVFSFDGGTICYVTVIGGNVYVAPSDTNYICSYTLASCENTAQQFRSLFEKLVGEIDMDFSSMPMGKPVIYLYSPKEQIVSVKLDFAGTLTYTFPTYDNGWNVRAKPDGTITNLADNSTHYYLFWEGLAAPIKWDFSKGSIVAGKDTEAFFKKVLPQMGLTPKEYNDFIVFWTPQLQDSNYNLITFAAAEYEAAAKLTVEPKPDSILRVHMAYKPLDNPNVPVAPTPQTFVAFERKGFTVVEWGGTAFTGKVS